MADINEKSDSMVKLTSVQGEMEASIIAGILESEGVDVLVKSNMASGTLPFTADGMGKVTLYVMEEDLVKARVIVKEYRKGE